MFVLSNPFPFKPSIVFAPHKPFYSQALWSNGLASQCKFSICVWLAFHLATLLCWLGKSTQVFHRLATQHKSTRVDHKSTVYVWNLRTFRLYGLRELASRLANPFGHHSQVRLVLQTCADLRWLASPFGQGSKPKTSAVTRFPQRLISFEPKGTFD